MMPCWKVNLQIQTLFQYFFRHEPFNCSPALSMICRRAHTQASASRKTLPFMSVTLHPQCQTPHPPKWVRTLPITQHLSGFLTPPPQAHGMASLVFHTHTTEVRGEGRGGEWKPLPSLHGYCAIKGEPHAGDSLAALHLLVCVPTGSSLQLNLPEQCDLVHLPSSGPPASGCAAKKGRH